jgi:hypothetical protein
VSRTRCSVSSTMPPQSRDPHSFARVMGPRRSAPRRRSGALRYVRGTRSSNFPAPSSRRITLRKKNGTRWASFGTTTAVGLKPPSARRLQSCRRQPRRATPRMDRAQPDSVAGTEGSRPGRNSCRSFPRSMADGSRIRLSLAWAHIFWSRINGLPRRKFESVAITLPRLVIRSLVYCLDRVFASQTLD